ncbi:PD40 domain-containing protein [Chondromyces crocatus]|uniref:Translocation protein TolB n=1 Tax=Chondromyces crocatus TaxID=52 RepID=A0A0K1E914_CHOCO|nr:PD40 domain-containing protein [Chondromyces crocatus]AKT37162.1 uncharacterized protein CMC5_012920 [Chondromyces crocatus]
MSDVEGSGDEVDGQDFMPRRRKWPALLALGVLVAAAGGAGLWLSRRPVPLRVLIAIDLDGTWWEGSEPAAELADRVGEHLTKLGFEPVRGGDPEVAAVLEKASSPEEAARKLRAAFLVTSLLVPERIEHPVDKGYVEVRVAGGIAVRHMDDAEACQQQQITGWSGAPEKDEAMRLVARSLSSMAVDAVVPSLLAHPTIQSVLESSDIKRLEKLQPAKKYVAYRQSRLKEVEDAYAATGREREAAERGAKVQYHSVPSAADTLGTVGPAGALVRTADVTPFISPTTLNLTGITRMETVVWRAPDGKERPLWSGYHIFSQPSAAPEGSPVLFVEDLFGWAKTLTVVDAGGKARRLRVDAQHRFVGPEVAPGGKLAALYDRACRDCAGDLLVISLDDGSERFLLPLDGGEFHGFTWLSPTSLAYLHRPKPPSEGGDEADLGVEGPVKPAKAQASTAKAQAQVAPAQVLTLIDVSKRPASVVKSIEVPASETWARPSASTDGRKLAVVLFKDGPNRLATIDVESGKVTVHDPEGRADEPAMSPDGTRVAFSREGDIALLTLATGETRALTANPMLERSPRFSPDGKRVYFESVGADPSLPRRQVSLVASVEVP